MCLCLLLTMLSACRIHSMINLENPEFPPTLRLEDLSGELLEKYSVGNVIVQPLLRHDQMEVSYYLTVLFASTTNSMIVSVKEIALLVNGEEIIYGEEMLGKWASDWALYPLRKPFYVLSIRGISIDPPKVDMVKARVDVSLMVSVKDESGKVLEKQIDTYFVPKKRSYLE